MEKKMQTGVELSRLLSPTSEQEEILCPICHRIFMEPVACSECQSCFCSLCIEAWLEENKNGLCPNNCHFVLKKAPPLLLKLLNKLKIKCKNFQSGCNEEINYELITKHETECGFLMNSAVAASRIFLKKIFFIMKMNVKCSLKCVSFVRKL